MSFSGKVVVVTGASSGIGAEIAIKFASEGAQVTIVARNEEKLQNVAQKCEASGSRPLVVIADVTIEDDAKRIIEATVQQFGKLDILINNAGVGGGVSILDESFMAGFDKIMNTNLRSVAYLTSLAASHIIETRGNIVNISSVASTSILTPRSAAYCASKAALDHFTRCLALELSTKGVRVNSVNPGPVNTDIIDNMGVDNEAFKERMWNMFKNATVLGKLAEPDEVADVVLFLASDKARSITGASYTIDNGSLLRGAWSAV